MAFDHAGFNASMGTLIHRANQWPDSRGAFSTAIRDLVLQTVNDEDPLHRVNDIREAMLRLRDYMRADGRTYEAHDVTAAAPVFTGNGDGVLEVSITEAETGDELQNVFGETLRLQCENDGQGQGESGAESWLVTGEANVSPLSDFYPGGSGARGIQLTDSASGPNNRCAAGDFERWSIADDPDGWRLTSPPGGEGTNIRQSTDALRGAFALELPATGSTMAMESEFGVAAECRYWLEPEQRYTLGLWCKVASATTGTLQLAVKDGVGAIVGDALVIDLSTVGTAYERRSVELRTPTNLPPSYRLVLETTVDNARDVLVDDVGVIPYPAPYLGGPGLVIVPGDRDYTVGDEYTIEIRNDAPLASFVGAYARYLNQRDIVFPTSDTPSDPDSLIGA